MTIEENIQRIMTVFSDWGNLNNRRPDDDWSESELRELALDIATALS